MDMISALWNGEIAPCEHCGAKDVRANILYGKLKWSREAVEEGLEGEQCRLLEQYSQCWEDYLLRMTICCG